VLAAGLPARAGLCVAARLELLRHMHPAEERARSPPAVRGAVAAVIRKLRQSDSPRIKVCN